MSVATVMAVGMQCQVTIFETSVNVKDSVVIGEKMASSFRNSFPTGFHAKISSQVKTIDGAAETRHASWWQHSV